MKLRPVSLRTRNVSFVSSLPFPFFLADREQSDARRLDAEEHLRVEVAHDRELAEVVRLGVDVRADVEQQRVALDARQRPPPARDG